MGLIFKSEKGIKISVKKNFDKKGKMAYNSIQ